MKTSPVEETTRGIPGRKKRQAELAGEERKTRQKVMKAAAIDGFDPSSVLKVANLPLPEAEGTGPRTGCAPHKTRKFMRYNPVQSNVSFKCSCIATLSQGPH